MQKAIAGENLDGWLFFNFRHRDPVADRILGINPETMNTRAWYYLVPALGEPVKILHEVEPDQLKNLPGNTVMYMDRQRLISSLGQFSGRWGAQYSEELSALSCLDFGTALTIQSAGITLESSASLIQRFCGLIDNNQIQMHEEAADHLYDIVEKVWARLSAAISTPGKKLYERDVQQWILDEFNLRNLETEHLPVVACGKASGNPHYAAEDNEGLILKDSVLQLDLWARQKKPGSVFADISWVGFTGKDIPEDAEKLFSTVAEARDRCAGFISERLAEERSVTGAEADEAARRVLIDSGNKQYIKHRTGHGIDTELHGNGTGLDSVEFPDKRFLLEGSCFSIEPGLYLPEFGMRTEIDAYINRGRLIISGRTPQKRLLTI